MLTFEWDPRKAEANLKQHGVSFELAERIFDDPDVLFRRDFFEGEVRDHAIGTVGALVTLLVAHTVTYEDADSTRVRIISAWQASRALRKLYRESLS